MASDARAQKADAKMRAVFQKLQHEFSLGFLYPLMTGGPAQLTRPLPPHALGDFALSRPTDHDADHGVHDALVAIASEIAPVHGIPYPDRGGWALAMAAHNLAILTDPKLDRAFARGAAPTILSWAAGLIEAAGEPTTRGEALVRFAILDRFFAAERKDVTVTNWAYTYRFPGRPVPKNVTAMPRLRFVKQRSETRSVETLLAELATTAEAPSGTPLELSYGEGPSIDVPAVRARLIEASPITALVQMANTPGFASGRSALAVLSDPRLRNGIAHRVSTQSFGTVATRVGAALRKLVDTDVPGPMLGAAGAFALELAMMFVLDRRDADLVPPAAGDLDALHFWAILPAALIDEDALDSLEIVPPEHRMRLGAFAGAIEERTPPPVRAFANIALRRMDAPQQSPGSAA